MNRAKRHLGILLCTTSLLSGVANAQQEHSESAEAQQNGAIDEIIVTAQKRSERLGDVPLSVTAVSGDQLARQGVTSPTDLERVVPGFTYQKSNNGVPVFTIRGIGLYDNFVGVAPTVTVYVDQIPLPYLAMTEGAGLDLERVEALKGPQGTLFGQNSTGGAINYIASKPTKTPQAGLDLTYGRFNQVDAQGFVSGPLSNTLAARVAVRHEFRDGWQRSQTRPDDRLGDRDFTAARLLLDWQPTDDLKLEFAMNGWWDKSETQATQFIGFVPSRPVPPGYPESTAAIGARAPAPNDPFVADWDANTNFHQNTRLYQPSLRADLQLTEALTLTSITAYSDFSTVSPNDNDGTDFNNFRRTVVAQIGSFSQELRIAGDLSDRIKLTAGGNYQHDRIDDQDVTRYISSNNGIGPRRYSNFINLANQKVETSAGFGSVDFKLTDTVTVQAGLRYTSQDRRFQGCLQDAGDGALAAALALVSRRAPVPAGSCVTIDGATGRQGLVRKSLNEDNFSWRAGLNWKPTPDSLLYASVTKGYKSGSFSPLPAVFADQLTPVTQESVLSYETGFKLSGLGSIVQLSGAAFYYDYQNKQILGFRNLPPFGALPALQNIPKSNVRGAELEATVRPIAGLRISGGATYVKSRVDGSFIAPDALAGTIDLNDRAFPSTPKWQFVADAEYDFPINGDVSAFLGGGITHRSSTYTAFTNSNFFKIDAYSLVDLRAGIEQPDGNWRLQVWGKNVFNQFYVINATHAVDAVARFAGMPATYGVTLSTRF